MDKIAVMIPCYNEAQTVQKVVRDYKEALPEATIYVYDNNSTDGTAELAKEAGAVVRHEYMQGKGNVIRRMFREIDAECYIMADGDDTYPAEFAPQMVDLVLNHQADMVVGDRLSSTYATENKRPFHNMGNNMVRWFINTLFDAEIKDIMTGMRAFSYQFVKSYPVQSRGFEIETEMSIHSADKNMHIENVIIDYRDRPEGSVSKLNTFSDGAKVLGTIWRSFMTFKPKVFYTMASLVLVIVAFCFMVPVFIDYAHTGLVGRYPTLICGCFVILAAVQCFFAGLILNTINHKNRQDFEMQLNHIHRELDRIKDS